MKTYSQVNLKSWSVFRKLHGGKTEEEYVSFMLKYCLFQGDAFTKRAAQQNEMVFNILWRFRKSTHYFLEDGLADFCQSSIKTLSREYFKLLPRPKMVAGTVVNGIQCPPMRGLMVIHFPIKERKKSLLVIPSAETVFADDAERTGECIFIASDGENQFIDPGNDSAMSTDTPQEIINVFRLIYGLSMYMDAFPETIIQAKCGDVNNWNHHYGEKNIVRRCAEIEEHDKNSISPHWRRGHFRLLSSPKYTKKQFQSIFVKGVFVKGHAFEVLSDSPSTTNGE